MAAPPDKVQHIVVLMMSGRSFDHMLGGLKAGDPRIDGLDGTEWNPDSTGTTVTVEPHAVYQGIEMMPGIRFADVDQQIFGTTTGPQRSPTMQGFVTNYFQQVHDNDKSHRVMHYFAPDRLPVLSTLAREFAVFNRWFSSVPGPQICNRLFAHYGTSFGLVQNELRTESGSIPSVFERLVSAKRSAKFYYYDQQSPAMDVPSLIVNQPAVFGTFSQFLSDCQQGTLPNYSYVEPNHSDHTVGDRIEIASDQFPDHDVQVGESFIATVYNAIRNNDALWQSTALLIVYDQHCGFYDHVVPQACVPDGYSAGPEHTGTGETFIFNRLGIRVPAVLVSPWIHKGTVIPRIFEHASIPATVTAQFLGSFEARTPREKAADTFLDALSETLRTDSDLPVFRLGGETQTKTPEPIQPNAPAIPTSSALEEVAPKAAAPLRKRAAAGRTVPVPPPRSAAESKTASESQPGPSTHVARDRWTVEDTLGHRSYAYAIYRFLTADDTKPPLAISIQAPWGGGKTSLMRMIQRLLDPDAYKKADQPATAPEAVDSRATVKDVIHQLKSVSAKKEDAAVQQAAQPVPGATQQAAVQSGQPTIPPIKDEGKRRVTVWFNAWKYESTAQVWAGMADCIVQEIGERLDPVERELFWFHLQLRRVDVGRIRKKIYEQLFAAFWEKLIPWLIPYLAGIVLFIAAVLTKLWTGAGGLLVAEIAGLWTHMRQAKAETEEKPAHLTLGEFVQAPDYAANLGFVHEVVEDLKRVFALIPRKDLPMVIFIDDLDRCSPGKVAEVVEAINLFLAGEFPDCMFILGIDDEMVAAALDKAHSDVIAKLPVYARSTSIGWRFMDKFVQLPFVVPPPGPNDLNDYVASLMPVAETKPESRPDAFDKAAQVVQKSPAPLTSDQVVQQVAAQQGLAAHEQESLKKDVAIIQHMDENIKRFNDQEQSMRDLISGHAKEYFNNPRDMKRFVNLFRFYYFLRAARSARGEKVASVEQMCRWLALSLKWPEVVRWLRRQQVAEDGTAPLASVESFAGKSEGFAAWQAEMDKALGLKPEDRPPWVGDRFLYQFFHKEAGLKTGERLSSCTDMGLW